MRMRSHFTSPVDHLGEGRLRLQQRSCIALQGDAAPRSLREAQDIVDHRGHAHDRSLHHDDNLVLLLVLDSSAENTRVGANGSEGIAEIVPKHGDELLAQRAGSGRSGT